MVSSLRPYSVSAAVGRLQTHWRFGLPGLAEAMLTEALSAGEENEIPGGLRADWPTVLST